ncbi:MFS transporter [Bacillus thuringiensis]|uniref:MFS transporter n=1 Tax=Bacillus cereus group TaxID=86661 RepID=UPI000A3A4EEA|nr:MULTISPECIES: MFS transporter [Bacillus cereus group]MCU5601573.1 MFS transporter [Bacillus cereus]MCU5759160.1 MFS transporter [Bacillus cereus]MED3067008.1 MFS transporter [Bacillus thuringiensis]OUB28138.1 ABC transporter permease [Bacillus thuringiensis serovar palmanyolensis]PRT09143.1 MFS transporter [Bacillus thuringiensis]
MFNSYREIFSAPGTKGFSLSGFIARMPISMMGIGIVTMLSQVSGDYWLAGAVAATFTLSSALLAPHISRMADQLGQSRILLPTTGISVFFTILLLLCTKYEAPYWTLFLSALCAGCMPNMSAMVRARWTKLYRGSHKLHTAFSFESVVDEICFIIGPVLSVSLSVMFFPEAGPLLSSVFLTIGVCLFTMQKSTEPPVHPRDITNNGTVFKIGSLRVLVFTLIAIGTIFGTIDVVSVAFAEQQGNTVAASFVLSVYAIGSCLAGLIFGTLKLNTPPYNQFLIAVTLSMITMLPLVFVNSITWLVVIVFFAGLSVAPTMIITMGLVEKIVPESKITEGMTWAITGLGIGVSLGSAIAGLVIDNFGAHVGFNVAIIAGGLALTIALLGYKTLHSAYSHVVIKQDEHSIES